MLKITGNVQPRGGDRWELTAELPRDPVTHKRNRRTKTVHCANKKEAEKALRDFLSEIEGGMYVATDRTTVSQWMTTWMEVYAIPRGIFGVMGTCFPRPINALRIIRGIECWNKLSRIWKNCFRVMASASSWASKATENAGYESSICSKGASLRPFYRDAIAGEFVVPSRRKGCPFYRDAGTPVWQKRGTYGTNISAKRASRRN